MAIRYTNAMITVTLTAGTVSSRLFLTSKHFVPERIINQIDRRSHLMMSGGFHRFYDSLAAHLAKVRARQRELEREATDGGGVVDDDDDEDFQSFTFKQFVGVMLQRFAWLGLASLVFVIEIITHLIKQRNQRNALRHRLQRDFVP